MPSQCPLDNSLSPPEAELERFHIQYCLKALILYNLCHRNWIDSMSFQIGTKTELKDQVTRKNGKMALPPAQAIVQHRVVSLKHNYSIKPSLREEIAAMVVHNVPPFFHQILELITNLRNQRDIIRPHTNPMPYGIHYEISFHPTHIQD